LVAALRAANNTAPDGPKRGSGVCVHQQVDGCKFLEKLPAGISHNIAQFCKGIGIK
jgi:hypothetical protein